MLGKGMEGGREKGRRWFGEGGGMIVVCNVAMYYDCFFLDRGIN